MIVVYGIREQLDPVKARLSDVIHGCMKSVLTLPDDKRAHRFVPLAREDFYFPGGRSERYVIIEINLMAGRKPETIKRLIKTLFAQIERELGILRVDVEITVEEQPAYYWGFRGMTGDEPADLKYKIDV